MPRVFPFIVSLFLTAGAVGTTSANEPHSVQIAQASCWMNNHPADGCEFVIMWNVRYCDATVLESDVDMRACSLRGYVGVPVDVHLRGSCHHYWHYFTRQETDRSCRERSVHATVSSGSLPPGLSIDTSTGHIVGTPTRAGIWQSVVTFDNPIGDDLSVTSGILGGDRFPYRLLLHFTTEGSSVPRSVGDTHVETSTVGSRTTYATAASRLKSQALIDSVAGSWKESII